jgi:hypothetical protein
MFMGTRAFVVVLIGLAAVGVVVLGLVVVLCVYRSQKNKLLNQIELLESTKKIFNSEGLQVEDRERPKSTPLLEVSLTEIGNENSSVQNT